MITLYEYNLSFHRPFKAGGIERTHRNGLIIRYHDSCLDIAGEIAPLPGFSAETTEEITSLLFSRSRRLNRFLDDVNQPEQISNFLNREPCPPSAQFGISCLALQLISCRNPSALQGDPFIRNSTKVHINGVIGLLPKGELLSAIEHLYRRGCRTIKLKCGDSPGLLPDIIRKASENHPDLLFRVDPNRSWPLVQAPAYLDKFKQLPVEYCEEPCLFNNLDEFRKLKDVSAVPLALDESIVNLNVLQEIFATRAADIVVLKPMLLGNILELLETCFRKETHSIDKVCTTSLESGVGRNSIAYLTSLIGSPHVAHGLDTGRLMREDLYKEKSDNVCTGSGNGFWCIPFDKCQKEHLKKIDQL